MVQLVRTLQTRGNMAQGVTTPVAKPVANDPNWAGKDLVLVVAHEGTGALNTGSHYFTFSKVANVWWRVDTGTQTIVQQNPFTAQMGSRDRAGFTINFLLFK